MNNLIWYQLYPIHDNSYTIELVVSYLEYIDLSTVQYYIYESWHTQAGILPQPETP